MISEKTCDYCFALCVVLLITFQFWCGAPHISFYEDNSDELFKSHLYVGSSSMPAGWTIYMCSKEKTNHMSYNISVIENSKAWTRTIFGNASRMPIPTTTKPPSGGILSYVLSKPQMDKLANDPQIEQVYVEPLMHCLDPVKSCSRSTKQRSLVINDIQCLAIANPNNHEVKVEFMVNFYVTNVNDDENLPGTMNDIDGDGDDDDEAIMKSHHQQEINQEINQEQEKEIKEKENVKDTKEINTKSRLIFDATYTVFSVILRSGINT